MGATETKVRIRGIYSTALTRLLLDNGFKIVEPSAAIKERFSLNNAAPAEPDLLIHDRLDRQGVRVFGKHESIDALKAVLQASFDDAVTREWSLSVNGIYKGQIKGVDSETGSVLVSLGSAVGAVSSYENVDASRDSVLVQVEGKHVGSKHPALTSQVKLLGKYAILLSARKIGVSFKISDIQRRNELYMLGKELATPHWGIIWRSAAVEASQEVLKEEVDALILQGEQLLQKAEAAAAPALVVEGTRFMDVEFPALSKQKLDELRSCVAPTLRGHHFYKAHGGNVAAELELAEKMLESGKPREEIEQLFQRTIETEQPKTGATILIQHVKLRGRVLNLGEAVLEESDASAIRFRRVFKHEGVYDGLGVAKEQGDYAVTETNAGAWHTRTDYYSEEGRHKGTYVNINTPVETYTDSIRYVDLEVDLCILPNGDRKLVDAEKLEQAFAEGYISRKLVERAKNEAEEMLKKHANV